MLRIQLASEPRFRGGDRVRGEVIVQAPPTDSCLRLWIYAWHGIWAKKGDEFDRTWAEPELTLCRGEPIEDGQIFPFELELPHGPPTYDGDTVWLYWNLTARALWNGDTDQTVGKLRITLDPARLGDVVVREQDDGDAGPYRGKAPRMPPAPPQLWRMRSAEQLQDGLGDSEPVRQLQSLTRQASRHVRGERRSSAVWRVLGSARNVLAFFFILVPLYLYLGQCGVEAYTKGSVINLLGAILMLALTAVPLAVLFVLHIVRHIWPRLRHGRITLELLDPAPFAALAERPEMVLRARARRGRPARRLHWELRVVENGLYKRTYKQRGNTRTEHKWETGICRIDRGDLDYDPRAAAADGGQLIHFAPRLSNRRPSTVITEGRELRWKLCVWCESLHDTYSTVHDLVVVPFQNELPPEQAEGA